MIRFIPEVFHHGQLLAPHLAGDLLQHARWRHLVGQSGNHDLSILLFPGRPHFDRAITGLVNPRQIIPRRNDLRPGGVIGPLDVLAELLDGGGWLFDQANACTDDFVQVVWRNIRRHAHGDARAAVEQQVWQPGRQALRLFQRAVEIGLPVHGAHVQFRQQRARIGRKPRFGVAHGGEGFGVIRRAEIALTVDQGITEGEGLCHQDHGLIAGRIPMRMKLAQHITHCAC